VNEAEVTVRCSVCQTPIYIVTPAALVPEDAARRCLTCKRTVEVRP
jgi:hypothetical protein